MTLYVLKRGASDSKLFQLKDELSEASRASGPPLALISSVLNQIFSKLLSFYIICKYS